jgi:hypothetical protein
MSRWQGIRKTDSHRFGCDIRLAGNLVWLLSSQNARQPISTQRGLSDADGFIRGFAGSGGRAHGP